MGEDMGEGRSREEQGGGGGGGAGGGGGGGGGGGEDLEGLGRHAFPLLGGLLHGLAQRLGVVDDGLELGVGQHPQQVVQDEQQLGCQHVAVLRLYPRGHTEREERALGQIADSDCVHANGHV